MKNVQADVSSSYLLVSQYVRGGQSPSVALAEEIARAGFVPGDDVVIVPKSALPVWRDAEKELPHADVPVIARYDVYGMERRIRATMAGLHTLDLDEEGDACKCGKCDGEFCAAGGWYENNEYEDTHWQVTATITHWMPLPEFP